MGLTDQLTEAGASCGHARLPKCCFMIRQTSHVASKKRDGGRGREGNGLIMLLSGAEFIQV